jgi:hypothetical protein
MDGAAGLRGWSTQGRSGLARGLEGDSAGIWARQGTGSNQQSSPSARASIALPNRSIAVPHPPHAGRNASCGTPIGRIVRSNRLIEVRAIMMNAAIFSFCLIS